MSELFITLLALHVIIGVLGVGASYMLLMGLFHRVLRLSSLRIYALTAFLSYLLSWATGGYYYVFRYGAEVKPIIKASAYPWAHAFFMETKEHLFLLLPVITFVILLILWAYGERMNENKSIKQSLIALTTLVFLIGVFITASGIIISGSAGA